MSEVLDIEADIKRAEEQRTRIRKRVDTGNAHESHLAYADGLVAGLESARSVALIAMKERDALRQAIRDIRDCVLHERHQLAEAGLDCDQVNAVLGIIDDHVSIEV